MNTNQFDLSYLLSSFHYPLPSIHYPVSTSHYLMEFVPIKQHAIIHVSIFKLICSIEENPYIKA